MKKSKPLELLYFHPKFGCTEAIEDELTLKFKTFFDKKKETEIIYKGVYICACGQCSTNTDYTFEINSKTYQTHSLALHYLRDHRSEVPLDQLLELAALLGLKPGNISRGKPVDMSESRTQELRAKCLSSIRENFNSVKLSKGENAAIDLIKRHYSKKIEDWKIQIEEILN